MVGRGDVGRSIWFTEFGWSSHANTSGTANWNLGVTQQQQAQLVVRAYRHIAARYPYVARAYWYNEREQIDSHLQDNHYGLLNRDLTPKPAYRALSAYLHGLASAAPTGSTTSRWRTRGSSTTRPAVQAQRAVLWSRTHP